MVHSSRYASHITFRIHIAVAKKKSAIRKKSAPAMPSFEESLERLDSIVQRLEGGQLALADSLQQYEQGVRHLNICYKMLEDAERRIELVQKVDSEGTANCEPFIEAAGRSSTVSAGSPGSAPRGRRKNSPNDVDDGSTLF
jgi:exodeoxyribonuclease VII small subunit